MANQGAHRHRSPLGMPIVVAVAGLAVIAFAQVSANRHSIEDKLTRASVHALMSAGIAGARVDFVGRDADIVVAGSRADASRAESVVQNLNGVRVATARVSGSGTIIVPPALPGPVPAATTPAPATPATTLPIGLTFENGVLTASGSVPSDAVQAQVIDALKRPGVWQLVDKLQINAALAPATPAWISSLSGIAGAVPADGSRVVARFDGDRVIVRGTPASAQIEQSILSAAAATVSDRSMVVDGMDVPAGGL